ncbi:hypothetical protein TrLO_g2078 [Triparma laevis f. longispina]|nr:hypothetical protein TrLO_g2078 [Triparma laevis f. longispina]
MKIASGNRKYAAVRLMLGALLSTFDTMTDIYMVYTYYSTNEHAFARATMFSLFANIAIQLGIVVLQNKNLGLGRLVKEMMYVIFFIKPGVDASRVVLGTEQSVGSVTNPKIEMILSKLSELFTEAIPGSLIQSYAFLTGANQTTAAIFSIIVSIFCAAFTSAGVSFDMDLDRASRAQTPQFFGYIPNGMKVKGKVFLSMFVMSACQLAAKAFACALGAVQSFLVVFAYMAIDFAIFFGYKLCRRDFWYWIPVDGATGIFVSILFRIIGKTVTDFTALLQFRHPFDLGGAYYCWTLLSTPFVCFYFGWAYLQYVESEEGEARNLPMKLFPWQVYTGIGSLMLVHFINVMYFLTTINSKYIRTFYSTLSGNQQEIGNFVNPERADERKIDIFSRNRHKWERIEEEVLDWVNLKIPEWNESQPTWWNARRKASIPDWAVREEGYLKSIRSVEVIEVVKRMRTSRREWGWG